jgi:hypothetical protein
MMMVVAIELAKKFPAFRGLLQCLQEPTCRLNIVCTLNSVLSHISTLHSFIFYLRGVHTFLENRGATSEL